MLRESKTPKSTGLAGNGGKSHLGTSLSYGSIRLRIADVVGKSIKQESRILYREQLRDLYSATSRPW
jgi:hypothetical protein